MVGRFPCRAPETADAAELSGWAAVPEPAVRRLMRCGESGLAHATAYGLISSVVRLHCRGELSAETLLRLVDACDAELDAGVPDESA